MTGPDRLDRLVVMRAEGTEFLVPSRVGAWVTPAFAAAHPEEAERLLRMLRSTSQEGYAACCETLEAFDVRDLLPGITAPTLVVASLAPGQRRATGRRHR